MMNHDQQTLKCNSIHNDQNIRAIVIGIPFLQRIPLTATNPSTFSFYRNLTQSIPHSTFNSNNVLHVTEVDHKYRLKVIDTIEKMFCSFELNQIPHFSPITDESIWKSNDSMKYMTTFLQNYFSLNAPYKLYGIQMKISVLNVAIFACLDIGLADRANVFLLTQNRLMKILMEHMEMGNWLNHCNKQSDKRKRIAEKLSTVIKSKRSHNDFISNDLLLGRIKNCLVSAMVLINSGRINTSLGDFESSQKSIGICIKRLMSLLHLWEDKDHHMHINHKTIERVSLNIRCLLGIAYLTEAQTLLLIGQFSECLEMYENCMNICQSYIIEKKKKERRKNKRIKVIDPNEMFEKILIINLCIHLFANLSDFFYSLRDFCKCKFFLEKAYRCHMRKERLIHSKSSMLVSSSQEHLINDELVGSVITGGRIESRTLTGNKALKKEMVKNAHQFQQKNVELPNSIKGNRLGREINRPRSTKNSYNNNNNSNNNNNNNNNNNYNNLTSSGALKNQKKIDESLIESIAHWNYVQFMILRCADHPNLQYRHLLYKMAKVYTRLGFMKIAIERIQESIMQSMRHSDKTMQALCISEIAALCLLRHLPEQALERYNVALTHQIASKDHIAQIESLLGIALSVLAIGNQRKSLGKTTNCVISRKEAPQFQLNNEITGEESSMKNRLFSLKERSNQLISNDFHLPPANQITTLSSSFSSSPSSLASSPTTTISKALDIVNRAIRLAKLIHHPILELKGRECLRDIQILYDTRSKENLLDNHQDSQQKQHKQRLLQQQALIDNINEKYDLICSFCDKSIPSIPPPLAATPVLLSVYPSSSSVSGNDCPLSISNTFSTTIISPLTTLGEQRDNRRKFNLLTTTTQTTTSIIATTVSVTAPTVSTLTSSSASSSSSSSSSYSTINYDKVISEYNNINEHLREETTTTPEILLKHHKFLNEYQQLHSVEALSCAHFFHSRCLAREGERDNQIKCPKCATIKNSQKNKRKHFLNRNIKPLFIPFPAPDHAPMFLLKKYGNHKNNRKEIMAKHSQNHQNQNDVRQQQMNKNKRKDSKKVSGKSLGKMPLPGEKCSSTIKLTETKLLTSTASTSSSSPPSPSSFAQANKFQQLQVITSKNKTNLTPTRSNDQRSSVALPKKVTYAKKALVKTLRNSPPLPVSVKRKIDPRNFMELNGACGSGSTDTSSLSFFLSKSNNESCSSFFGSDSETSYSSLSTSLTSMSSLCNEFDRSFHLHRRNYAVPQPVKCLSNPSLMSEFVESDKYDICNKCVHNVHPKHLSNYIDEEHRRSRSIDVKDRLQSPKKYKFRDDANFIDAYHLHEMEKNNKNPYYSKHMYYHYNNGPQSSNNRTRRNHHHQRHQRHLAHAHHSHAHKLHGKNRKRDAAHNYYQIPNIYEKSNNCLPLLLKKEDYTNSDVYKLIQNHAGQYFLERQEEHTYENDKFHSPVIVPSLIPIMLTSTSKDDRTKRYKSGLISNNCNINDNNTITTTTTNNNNNNNSNNSGNNQSEKSSSQLPKLTPDQYELLEKHFLKQHHRRLNESKRRPKRRKTTISTNNDNMVDAHYHPSYSHLSPNMLKNVRLDDRNRIESKMQSNDCIPISKQKRQYNIYDDTHYSGQRLPNSYRSVQQKQEKRVSTPSSYDDRNQRSHSTLLTDNRKNDSNNFIRLIPFPLETHRIPIKTQNIQRGNKFNEIIQKKSSMHKNDPTKNQERLKFYNETFFPSNESTQIISSIITTMTNHQLPYNVTTATSTTSIMNTTTNTINTLGTMKSSFKKTSDIVHSENKPQMKMSDKNLITSLPNNNSNTSVYSTQNAFNYNQNINQRNLSPFPNGMTTQPINRKVNRLPSNDSDMTIDI
ncbi:hypothetical protein SNEBB_001721 [Seison nebaliae]|nr:hypothetical protein SNEBB_001721 [Seison nebaliae]